MGPHCHSHEVPLLHVCLHVALSEQRLQFAAHGGVQDQQLVQRDDVADLLGLLTGIQARDQADARPQPKHGPADAARCKSLSVLSEGALSSSVSTL